MSVAKKTSASPFEGADIEEQTRAVLNLLAEPRMRLQDVPTPSPSADHCPNCGNPCSDLRSPYCGPSCRETAAFVRQYRAAIASGVIADPDRQAALGQKLWRLIGGGFPRRMPLIPDRVIRKVIEREGGRCQACGDMAVTVDHPGSG